MAAFGITLSKETKLFSKRTKNSNTKDVMSSGTPVRVLEVKYREGQTWLEVQKIDDTKKMGYILEDKSSQNPWVYCENIAPDFSLFKKIDGQYADTKKILRKGSNFYVISTSPIFTNIFYENEEYIYIGELKVKMADEWSTKRVVLMVVAFVCLMYGAFEIAPDMLGPGRYPRILFFLPGLAIAAVAVPAVWGLFYAYEEIEKRS